MISITGSASPSHTPTENSLPLMYSSTRTFSSSLKASFMASALSSAVFAMVTPTLDPPQAGFTTQGRGSSSSLTVFSKRSSVTPLGIGIPSGIRIFFVISLSMHKALLRLPGPVYFIPERSRTAWTFPFSPFSPCNPINTMSASLQNSSTLGPKNSPFVCLRLFISSFTSGVFSFNSFPSFSRSLSSAKNASPSA